MSEILIDLGDDEAIYVQNTRSYVRLEPDTYENVQYLTPDKARELAYALIRLAKELEADNG